MVSFRVVDACTMSPALALVDYLTGNGTNVRSRAIIQPWPALQPPLEITCANGAGVGA
jgi:hypothetical protein